MNYSLHPHIHFTHHICLLCAPPTCDNSHPLCPCFSFLGMCLCTTCCTFIFTSRTPPAYFVHFPHVITRTPNVFVSHFGPVFMYYLLHPHIYFTHPTCLLRTPPTCDNLAPPMSLFTFLGPYLCITHCTLTFMYFQFYPFFCY